MNNYDGVTLVHSPNWPQISDHLYRSLLIGCSRSWKINRLLTLIQEQDDDNYSFIDKIYLYIKDLNEAECSMIIKFFTIISFIMKTPNKRLHQQIAIDRLW